MTGGQLLKPSNRIAGWKIEIRLATCGCTSYTAIRNAAKQLLRGGPRSLYVALGAEDR
jgi:hypothetical protein